MRFMSNDLSLGIKKAKVALGKCSSELYANVYVN